MKALDSSADIAIVEAPVGAGKSYILRRVIEDERFRNNPIVFTDPIEQLRRLRRGMVQVY